MLRFLAALLAAVMFAAPALAVQSYDIISETRRWVRVYKFGVNEDIGTSNETIWASGGTYSGFLTAATQIEVVSTDATDTSSGDGCQSLQVEGLDSNFDSLSETFAMNGATEVPSVSSDWLRVFRAYCVGTGVYAQGVPAATGINAGVISVQVVSGGTVLASILAQRGQTEQTNYTVPRGFTAYLISYNVDIGVGSNNSGTFAMWQRRNADDVTTPFSPLRKVLGTSTLTFGISETLEYTLPFPAKTDLFWTGIRIGSQNINADVSYELILVPEGT